MKVNFFYFLIIAGLAVAGCDMVNPEEKTPLYVSVDSFSVVPTPGKDVGSLSHDIKSVLVYFNNQSVGYYNIPARIPILADGPGQVQLVPAVSFSGLNYVREYPYYHPDTFQIAYNPGTVVKHTGITRYRTNAMIKVEDFENGNPFIKVNAGNSADTVLKQEKNPAYVFEGQGAGFISLTTSHPSCEVITNQSFPIGQGNSYLEVNYKCDVPVHFGLQTTANGTIVARYLYGVYATDTWKKVYIGLSEFTGEYKSSAYNLMIKTQLVDGKTEAQIMLDNIKIVSFP
ncbi:MAG: hypothetical protein EOP56_03775 [Sphingobacteriales bacterium]|nr:MAG: hypothetical protein EOP56_03775 [Sphingobacteriales bacterium]